MDRNRVFDATNVYLPSEIDNVVYQHLHIDSSDRLNLNDSPASYSVALRERFSYVTSVELIDARIPINNYTITNNNNMLYYQETYDQECEDEYICCEIPVGKYDILKLLNVIKHLMNTNSKHHNKFACKLNESTGHITIECTSNCELFNLIWTDKEVIVGEGGTSQIRLYSENTKSYKEEIIKVGNKKNIYIKNSCGYVLGFKPINLKGHKYYISGMSYNIHPYEYLSLHISTDSGIVFKQVYSTNDATNDAFVIINTRPEPNKVYDVGKCMKDFNPPINFTRLNIKFLTPDGNLYDFNGKENYLLLEVSKVFGNQKVNKLSQLY